MRPTQGQTIRLSDYEAPQYRVLTVALDIKLHPTQTEIRSSLLIERARETPQDAPLKLDGDELELVSVSVEGKPVDAKNHRLDAEKLVLQKLPKKRKFSVEIETVVNPTANTKLMGLYRSSGNYCTQCEAEGFRRITFFPDRPDILAVFTTRLEADKKEVPLLLGNGNPVESGDLENGRHFAVWHDPHPKPCYLFALVGGNLGSIHEDFTTASGRKVRLGIYVEPGKEKSAHYAMDALIRSMRWDEEIFGCEYDLDVFNIVAVSDFNMGAMENKGLNIFNDKYVLADEQSATDTDYANIEAIIAHEYFHNWTGNRITCRDWFQLCLKEGLTVYRDQEFSSDMRSRPVKRIQDVRRLKTDQFPEDAGPLAHPVRPQTYREINNFYTATVYEKGAELVRMLATILGENKFRKGMALYLKRHDGDAATIEDFLKCFETAADTDLSQFFRWYEQAGTPLLNVTEKHDRQKKCLTLQIDQFVKPTPGQSHKKPMHIPLRVAFISKNGSEVVPGNVKGVNYEDGVIHLKKRSHKAVFEGIAENPVLSINRGFSAPVEISHRQTSRDLVFLARHDQDGFGRWQAFQNLATNLLLKNIKAIKTGAKSSTDANLLAVASDIAGNADLDTAFRTTCLTLPGESDLARVLGKNVDPDAVFKSWLHLNRQLGQALENQRPELIGNLATGKIFSPDAASAGKRSLHGLLMRMAVIARSKTALSEIADQYHDATNMTDRFNAFVSIVQFHPDKMLRQSVLDDFHKRFHKNHIVLDKWFSVQAMRPGSSTVSTVKRLMKHQDFNFSNPNRLRSLIAVFAMANPTGFHAANGKGYKLVADTIAQIDKINPQVAARLLTSFRSYKSLESGRQQLAEASLQSLKAKSDLSRDTSDILERTLG